MRYKEKHSITTRPPIPAPQPKTKHCEHRYKLIESNTETTYADGKPISVNLDAVFYCEKCLDIQSKIGTINLYGEE